MTEAINIAAQCVNGILPVDGGLLDQSAWFLSLHSQLASDQNLIESERWERMK